MMKNIFVIFAADNSLLAYDKKFDDKSAFDLVLDFSKKISGKTVIFADEETVFPDEFEIVRKEIWTCSDVIDEISKCCEKFNADYSFFSYGDTPFLNENLTMELVSQHEENASEYTFADGFPYGMTPEIIDGGCAKILADISKTVQKSAGDKLAFRDCIFSVMKGDINSFEIETLVADKDYRMFRLEFESSSKINSLACEKYYEYVKNNVQKKADLYEILDNIIRNPNIIQTVPSFYNLQITQKNNHRLVYVPESVSGDNDMDFQNFQKILSQISELSEKAVISLSCFGEPLLNARFTDFIDEIFKYGNLSVLIETNGVLISEELAKLIAEKNTNSKVDWIVFIDAAEKTLYSQIHNTPSEDFDSAIRAVQILETYFPMHVYPQMLRMKINEHQLETFYRFWKEKESPSKGQLIIQKYDNFCNLLPDQKPADLSPLERNPCWHLRRDMTILADGTVPLCRSCFNHKIGNVFEESVESVWGKFKPLLDEQLKNNYSEKCKICDEYYTFNF